MQTTIGLFRELAGDSFPELSSMVTSAPIENKDKVLDYLRRGKILAVASGILRDVITGQRIEGDMVIQSDGCFEWRGEIAYYFDKYNLKLPDEFILAALQ